MRTASSAVCPSRQRTGLVSKRKCVVVVNDPGVSGLHTTRPSRFVRTGIAFNKLSPPYLCVPQSWLFVRVAVEHKLAAMPSGGCNPVAATSSDDSGASANICGLIASGESQKGGTGTLRRRILRGLFMSKELVISAASHERRVAILEEGQLVEIYIEREKEFALVGSIYKGRVTRVLPGMQSAFVDIGLDGDAFLYVSDVFENLEDYDHGHGHGDSHGHGPAQSAAPVVTEVLPGETVGQGARPRPESHEHEEHHDEHDHETHAEAHHEEHGEEHHDEVHARRRASRHEHDNFGKSSNQATCCGADAKP